MKSKQLVLRPLTVDEGTELVRLQEKQFTVEQPIGLLEKTSRCFDKKAEKKKNGKKALRKQKKVQDATGKG